MHVLLLVGSATFTTTALLAACEIKRVREIPSCLGELRPPLGSILHLHAGLVIPKQRS